jgi:type IV secretion system protein VirB3
MDDQGLGELAARHRFFKGCTRPAMFMGVPLMPFMGVSGAFILLAMWAFYLASGYVSLMLVMAYIPILVVMRQMTKKDDQRLKQVMLRARMRLRHSNKNLWGAISYSPLKYKKR